MLSDTRPTISSVKGIPCGVSTATPLRLLTESFQHWRRCVQYRQFLRVNGEQIVARLKHRTLHEAVLGWHARSQEKAIQRQIVLNCLKKIQLASAMRALNTWRDFAHNARRLKEATKRILTRMQQSTLSKAFDSWRCFREEHCNHRSASFRTLHSMLA